MSNWMKTFPLLCSLWQKRCWYAAPSSPIFPNKLPLQDPTVGQAAQILQAKYEPIFAQMRWNIHKYHKLPLDSPVCGTLQFKICNLRFICKNIASQTWTNICTHVMDISINIINYPQTAQRLWQSAEHCNMQICILRLLCTNIASFDLKTHT